MAQRTSQTCRIESGLFPALSCRSLGDVGPAFRGQGLRTRLSALGPAEPTKGNGMRVLIVCGERGAIQLLANSALHHATRDRDKVMIA